MIINIYINIGVFVFGGVCFLSVFLLYIKNPEKFEYIISLIYRILSLIPLIKKKLVYKKTATSIQADINRACEDINKQAPNIIPHAMKLEWAKKGQDASTFLRNGEIIVKITPEDDNDRNIVISTLAYFGKGLIPQARHCLDKTLMRATEFTTAKQVFSTAKRTSAVSYIISNCIEPEITKNPKLGEDCSDLDILCDAGVFTRILLKQFEFLGKKLYATTPTAAVQQETRKFMNYLLQIALRRYTGVLPSFDFSHPRIRLRTLLVAKQETKQWGKRPYINRIKEAQSMGLEYLYLLAWGKENIDFTRSIAKEQELAGRLSVIKTSYYTQNFEHQQSVLSICIVSALNIDTSSKKIISYSGVLRSLLEEHIQELRDGKVEIVSVAREPGRISKIIVRSLVDDLDAVQCFKDKYQDGSLGLALADEALHVIPWSEDPNQTILRSLLRQNQLDKVTSIELNSSEKVAKVVINDAVTRRMAVGRNGINVNLASILTGWNIDARNE